MKERCAILTETRKRELDVSFESRRDMLQDAAKIIGTVGTMLSVGCGDGYFDLKTAEVFKPHRIILTDIQNSLQVQLQKNAEFQMVDVCSQEFLRRFQNQVTLVVCSQALHEVVDMFKAVQNLFAVLPVGGTTLIFDYSQEGLQSAYKLSKKAGLEASQHFTLDFANLVKYGLDTNKGIRKFWEEVFFPRVPGKTHLFFCGEVYMVIYVACQWGEVKPIPPELMPELRRLGYIS